MKRKPPDMSKPLPVLLHWRDAVFMFGPLAEGTTLPPVSMYSAGLLVAEDGESITIIQTLCDDKQMGERHETLTVVKGMLQSMTYLEGKETVEFDVKVTRKRAAKKKARKKR